MNIQKINHSSNSFKGLLVCLIGAFLIVPFFQGKMLAEELIGSVYIFILLGTLYALYGNHQHIRRIAIIGAIVLLSNILSYFTALIWLDNFSMGINIIFYIYAIALIFEGVFRNSKVTMNVILGAICIYLLVGVTWGMSYSLLDALMPHSFQMTLVNKGNTQLDNLVQNFIYFSFTTLSTLGYGDIIPLSTPARYLASLEAIFGQIYLSVLVSRLVGMHITQK